jgi:hypothetical protein
LKYYLQTRWGGSIDCPSIERMQDALDELKTDDPEHPDAWISREDGWTIAVHQGGLVVFENVDAEGGDERHQKGVSISDALRLWQLLADGDLEAIRAQPWLPGYG